jgi:hypothetical protein
MGQNKSLHHYAARSYLRGFGDNGHLWGWFRTSNEICDVHANTIAAEHGFYHLRRADGTKSDELEDALAVFDGMTPAIIASAVARRPLTDEDTAGVRHLYASLLARKHEGRDLLVDEVRATAQRVAADFDREFPEVPHRREFAVDFILRRLYDLPDHLATDADTISRHHVIELTDKILSVIPPHVCILQSKAQDFFTSDTPCAWFDPTNPPHSGKPSSPPWSSETVELTLPLGRRHVALIANRPFREDKVLVNFDGVRVINARTVFFAKRVLLAYPTTNAEEAGLFEAQVLTERSAFDTPILDAFETHT